MKKILFTILILATSATHAEVSFAPYGFIKASAIYADHALGSFNNINLSAPTYAVARTRDQDENSRTSFQTAQSRLGVVVKKSDALSGRFEFDFIDFSKSSPTTQMVPRVRRAVVTYKGDNWSADIGQDWDLFSPTNAYTYDIVGMYFNAGNTGFQRQQAQFHKLIDSWELSAALGMAAANPGVSDTDLEYSNAPTYALRAQNTKGSTKYGVSGIYSRLKYASVDNSRHESWGTSAYVEREVASYGLKAEVFYGQNLGNLGTLSLARGTATTDLKEYGGFVSGQKALENGWKVFGGVGMDQIENKKDLLPFALTATGSVGPSTTGIRRNFLSRLGVEKLIEQDFTWVFELSRYETNSKLAANEYKTLVAHSLETGILWKF